MFERGASPPPVHKPRQDHRNDSFICHLKLAARYPRCAFFPLHAFCMINRSSATRKLLTHSCPWLLQDHASPLSAHLGPAAASQAVGVPAPFLAVAKLKLDAEGCFCKGAPELVQCGTNEEADIAEDLAHIWQTKQELPRLPGMELFTFKMVRSVGSVLGTLLSACKLLRSPHSVCASTQQYFLVQGFSA